MSAEHSNPSHIERFDTAIRPVTLEDAQFGGHYQQFNIPLESLLPHLPNDLKAALPHTEYDATVDVALRKGDNGKGVLERSLSLSLRPFTAPNPVYMQLIMGDTEPSVSVSHNDQPDSSVDTSPLLKRNLNQGDSRFRG